MPESTADGGGRAVPPPPGGAWKKMNVPTYKCRACGHTVHGDEADTAAGKEAERMAGAVLLAAEAHERLDAIDYLADGAPGADSMPEGITHLTHEHVSGIRECLRQLTGTGDPGNKDVARAKARRRLEDGARAHRRMEECVRRHGSHNIEGDYCTNCGKPRWDLTDVEREAAGL